MEDDMTDEDREQRTDDGRQMEDRRRTTEDGGQAQQDMETSPVVSEQAAQDMSEDAEEFTPEIAEPTDADQDAVPEESEPVDGREAIVDQASAPAEESTVSESVEVPLTEGERQADQVIGMLLGESQETEQEEGEEQRTEDAEPEMTDAVNPSSVVSPPASEVALTIESVLEAILFATDEPLTESKLAGIVETTTKQVRESIESLNAKYAAENHAFRIEQIAGGYQMLTLNTYNPWLKKMLRVRSDNKLSPAAMETLAIIAYKQPIIRADIEAIRGVAVGEVIRSLMYKGLVKITGRAEILGRPMLYGTTKKFLEIFGLNSLKDLPKAEELKNPDRG